MGDEEKVAALFDHIRATYGHLDILVNNAASGVNRPALELTVRHWDWTMGINARGAWLCAKHAAPLMEGRGGSIVNISSLGSTFVMPDYLAVGVSKAALEALTRYLAVELASLGINVNAVAGTSPVREQGRGLRRDPYSARSSSAHANTVVNTARRTSSQPRSGTPLSTSSRTCVTR